MTLEEILSLVEKLGIKSVIVAPIIFIAISIFKTKFAQDLMGKLSDIFIERFIRNKVKSKTETRELNASDIENHDIFNQISFWIYSIVPTMTFSTDYRTAVFRAYLTIYLKIYRNNIEHFIKSKDYENMDAPQILKAFHNLVNMTVYEYEKEMSEVGIPNVIIEKMKLKNNDNIHLTFDLVDGIASSHHYDSDKNLLKVYSILNILATVLENTLYNSEEICNTINGQLKGMTFNKFTEPK